MKALWAMRHGETEWNLRGLLQGHADSPLSEDGRAQAAAAGELLAGEGLARLVSSDLGRARATAAIVAARLGLQVAHDPDLRELDVGELEGHPASDIVGLPGYTRHPSWRCPGGESLLELRERVLRALQAAIADGRPTLLVTHGGPLRVLLAEAGRVLPDRILDVVVPRAFVGRFPVAGGRLEPPRVLRA